MAHNYPPGVPATRRRKSREQTWTRFPQPLAAALRPRPASRTSPPAGRAGKPRPTPAPGNALTSDRAQAGPNGVIPRTGDHRLVAWENAGDVRPGDARPAPGTRLRPVESAARRHHRRMPEKPHTGAPPLSARHHLAARLPPVRSSNAPAIRSPRRAIYPSGQAGQLELDRTRVGPTRERRGRERRGRERCRQRRGGQRGAARPRATSTAQ
ncbi:hypothetical protein FRAAL0987 [Frankia alni ACN14a]|uniref:Uncharacterized protein n=1 Tax=Frankia alni (strain DSM 45986 / CECT 9034 / ACN14a) TaxID=326424 RepID=Q0RS13_FRAAA|nr:hypothetical protein FRAAL0987 [Frankia alni ACN14a]